MKPEKEKALLAEFKEAIKDCENLPETTDEYLSKWLIARNYNVKQAEKMLRKSLEWRRLNKIDNIVETFQVPEAFQKYYSSGRVGTDKLGCPVFIAAHGRVDFKGLTRCVTRKDFVRYFVWFMELNIAQGRAERRATGANKQIVSILISDMDHLSTKQIYYKPAIDAGLEFIKLMEANYPVAFRRIYFINAPKIFHAFFSMMKPLLNQATLGKIKIYSKEEESKWKTALLEEIDPSQLPAYYGGTMTDPDGDPKCPSKLNMGGKVPTEYYLNIPAPEPKDYMESLSMMPGAKKKMKFKVDVVNSILRWEFITEGGDLAYRVYRKSDGVTELIPHGIVESHMFIEEGVILCDVPGKYVLEFDNSGTSGSILKMKKVRYFITVDPPAPEEPLVDADG